MSVFDVSVSGDTVVFLFRWNHNNCVCVRRVERGGKVTPLVPGNKEMIHDEGSNPHRWVLGGKVTGTFDGGDLGVTLERRSYDPRFTVNQFRLIKGEKGYEWVEVTYADPATRPTSQPSTRATTKPT